MFFFESTSGAQKNIAELFDFIWPTAAAMWNLRWQVRGYLEAAPQASPENLMGRFVGGSGIPGVNLKKSCLDQSWEAQQEEFARIALTNTIAIFEAWLRQTLKDMGRHTSKNEKQLQFPTTTVDGETTGVQSALGRIVSSESAFVKNVFYPLLQRSRKYAASSQLENLLVCYRYFKEIRNSLIHHGGEADKKAEDAYLAFASIATPAQLHVAEVPKHQPVSAGAIIKLELRGVVGFSDIVMRIVTTLDAELARAQAAESYLKKRISRVLKTPVELSPDEAKRHQYLIRVIKKLNLPKPVSTTEFGAFLQTHNLASWKADVSR